MKNIWIVVKAPDNGPQQDFDMPRAARRGNAQPPMGAVEVPQRFISQDAVKEYYTTADGAKQAAQALAKKNPLTPYYVMEIESIFETGEPKVLEKEFNDAGELVLKKEATV